MLIADKDKSGPLLRHLCSVNNMCFPAEERPSQGMFEYEAETGFLFVTPDKWGLAIVKQQNGAHLWTLAVHPDMRRLGHGQSLLMEVNDLFRDITLHTRVDNVPAQLLYLKNGYRVEKVLKGYYPNKIDGLLMRRNYAY